MNKLLIIFLSAFVFLPLSGILNAQAPAWVKYEKRVAMFPTNSYIMGFSSEINYYDSDVNELIDRCKENAKNELTESVKVSIKSITVSGINNVNTGIDQETYEYVKQSSVSFSNLDLSGLTIQHYYNKKKKIAYAITYAKRVEVIKFYKLKINNGIKDLEAKKLFAEDMLKADMQQKALQSYFKCLTIFREVEEAQSILVALGKSDEASLRKDRIIELKAAVDKGINQLNNTAKNSISDVAYFIANGLKMQTAKLEGKVKLSSFTYQDTRMGSPLSKRLNMSLEQKLVSETNLNIHNQNYATQYKSQSLIDYIITGTYWDDNDYIKMIVVLRDFKTGKALASIETKLAKLFCEKNKINYLPENFIVANTKRKNFAENEVVGGDLNLEVWTNKGTDNLLFSENDTLLLFLRVNKACYIRFIYHLADGSKVLLLDDYFIDVSKVNKVYQLPEEFICAEPFGAEVLQVNAQTEKFERLNTKEQYGYNFITDDLDEVIRKTRGFKKLKEGVMKAENSIVITTMSGFDGFGDW
ncbi:MAG: hypothetical protein DRI95_11625 [Bacteroidetes bacterium]|nr:MAG: hypothetical protein DRI95_11625 [Bacteroidota bacterium]